MQPSADWIAVDWGTTHLRAWALNGRKVVADAMSTHGMGMLQRNAFEGALLELIADWLAPEQVTDVICCGMVGSRQGWCEAPYVPVPAAPLGAVPVAAFCNDPRLRVLVLPGLSQATPPDVMRGEETQIAGFLALNAGWDGVVCLPGTHSKWAQVSAGEIVSFQTCLTGELFSLLAGQSVLRHSVTTEGWDNDAFAVALSDTLSKPETLAARLFRLRAADLLDAVPPEQSRAELSGLLLGSELAATRPYWLGQQVAVIGADTLARHYHKALELQGVPATLAKADAMTLAGLTAAYRQQKATP